MFCVPGGEMFATRQVTALASLRAVQSSVAYETIIDGPISTY
jgi:hypothetical protein